MVRKSILVAAALVVVTAGSGCLLNKSDRDPNVRMQKQLFKSDGLPQTDDRRFIPTDPPSRLEPERVHGGII